MNSLITRAILTLTLALPNAATAITPAKRALGCASALLITFKTYAQKPGQIIEYYAGGGAAEFNRLIEAYLGATPAPAPSTEITRTMFAKLTSLRRRRGVTLKSTAPVQALINALGGVQSWSVVRRRGDNVTIEAELAHDRRLVVRSHLTLAQGARTDAREISVGLHTPWNATAMQRMAAAFSSTPARAEFNDYVEAKLARWLPPNREVHFEISGPGGTEFWFTFENGRFAEGSVRTALDRAPDEDPVI